MKAINMTETENRELIKKLFPINDSILEITHSIISQGITWKNFLESMNKMNNRILTTQYRNSHIKN
jgi:hypothetical protein